MRICSHCDVQDPDDERRCRACGAFTVATRVPVTGGLPPLYQTGVRYEQGPAATEPTGDWSSFYPRAHVVVRGGGLKDPSTTVDPPLTSQALRSRLAATARMMREKADAEWALSEAFERGSADWQTHRDNCETIYYVAALIERDLKC